MTFCCHNDEKKKLEIRLNRIEGQVRGINKMITENRDCMEILNQIISCQSALKGVWKEVVRGHLQNCITDALKTGKNSEALINELVEHLEKMK